MTSTIKERIAELTANMKKSDAVILAEAAKNGRTDNGTSDYEFCDRYRERCKEKIAELRRMARR